MNIISTLMDWFGKNTDQYVKITSESIPDGSWTSADFEIYNELQYQKIKSETDEFVQGRHNIFSDNELNDIETIFFKKVLSMFSDAGINTSLLRLNRLSDKTLNVRYVSYQIGRIKLNGRKTKIQVLTGDSVEWYQDKSLEEYINISKKWITYLRKIEEDDY
ncbi:hypothetical protein [Leuconostoc miyukkimchii]|uniref:hypothetical protein n=1 Tax=Leuconostoc miyukkimchii TaxID=910540 RepID=UPI001C7E0419|nr:hypothetical protein [Leuconostoc miyukkimchii]